VGVAGPPARKYKTRALHPNDAETNTVRVCRLGKKYATLNSSAISIVEPSRNNSKKPRKIAVCVSGESQYLGPVYLL
jgi:hypothetical protein